MPFVLPTPIKLGMLQQLLSSYTNHSDAYALWEGFTEGFSIGYNGPRLSREAHCLSSALANPVVVQEKLQKEIQLGRIAGPFMCKPFSQLQCSPIGLVPKREPHTFRLIHHLSFPSGGSINDFINREQCKVNYASFDRAVELVMEAGQGAWLAKSDIKSAFRLLPVSPSDYELLGFTFGGQYFYDKCLPMGCSISCSLFEKFSTFLDFQVKRMSGSLLVTHYLDDFLFVGPSASSCAGVLHVFSSLCNQLGVPIAKEKTEGPVQTITYLGLEIDAVKMQVQVPKGKVQALCEHIHQSLSKKKITLRSVQSLVGSLNFVCRAISPGRAFMGRLIALTRGLTKPHHRVRFTTGARLDLLMWLRFLADFNGVSAFLGSNWESSNSLSLFTDAAAAIGFGAYFAGRWTQGHWPGDIIQNPPSIAFLEFYPIVVAIHCWASLLSNSRVKFHTDNIAVVHIINKQSSHCPKIMHLLRLFVLQCLKFNIYFRAVHVPGKFNDIADALSRFQMARFRLAAPMADEAMTPLPSLPQVW